MIALETLMADQPPFLADLAPGMNIERVPVYVAQAVAGSDRNGKPYARYQFRDRGGSVQGIRWEHALAEAESGRAALVSGSVGTYRSELQLAVHYLEVLEAPSPAVVQRLRPADDPQRQARLRGVMEEARRTLSPLFWAIFREALGADPLDEDGPFWTYAAAQSKHHAEPGGLAWHTLTMYELAGVVGPTYPKLDLDLLRLAVLVHDLGKLDCYDMSLFGATQLSLDRTVGHTAYSISRVLGALARLRAAGQVIAASDEENLLHCVASHHGKKEFGAIYEPVTAEAAALHALDLIDSQARPSDTRPDPLPDRRLRRADEETPERRASNEAGGQLTLL
jgi:3'-5' exoribonuclease